MTVDFRCEKCGKLLSLDAEPASRVKCPYCKAKVQVPAGLASLPRPQVPVGAAAPPPPAPAAMAVTVSGGILQQPVYEQADPLMNLMARLMPWVISLFFHAGALVVLGFVTIVVLKTTAPAEVTVPDLPISDVPGSSLRPGYGNNPELAPRSPDPAGKEGGWAMHQSPVAVAGAGLGPEAGTGAEGGESDGQIRLYGVPGAGGIAGGSGSGGGGPAAPFGLTPGGGGGGAPRARFMNLPTKGDTYHVVYVVDRSGSMLETFDEIRKELKNSITRLTPEQTFHVIFFAEGQPKENPPRRLVPADVNAKRETARYLNEIQPQGQTDPIPALKRAFEVLSQAPSKKGKVIFLLTDGDFPDNDAVLKAIKNFNSDGSVHINTILHRWKVPSMMKLLQQIADENQGAFKFVEVSE